MTETASPSLPDQLAAATEWWREAGVDYTYEAEPVSWLSTPVALEKETNEALEQPRAKVTAQKISDPAPDKSRPIAETNELPDNLADFQNWWTENDALADVGMAERIAPRGVANADLMLLTSDPEAGDKDTLLSGQLGKLASSMLGAMQISGERAYFASALPCHTPHADWQAMQARGLGKIAEHHIALAAPKRLIIFGGNTLSLFGHDPAQGPAEIRKIALESGETTILAAWGLDRLLKRPEARKKFWQIWLEWTASQQ